MNSPQFPPSTQGGSQTKPSFACVRCSERKVRCNRQDPCESCVRHNVQCIFRQPKPSRRRRELVKDKTVEERLKRYEALLREKGMDPNQVTGTSEPEHQPKITESRSEGPEAHWILPLQSTIFKPRLLQGQEGTELVDNSLWSRVAEEIHHTEASLEDDSGNDASDHKTSNDDFSYVLGRNTSNTESSHPPAELIHQLWRIFTENCNPLTKLVHVPSLQPVIEKAITNIKHIPSGFEALMFAIYSMAVLSLTDYECREMLGESRAILLPHYRAATKTALSRAQFISSTSIVVLQALLLHIFSIRDDYEPRAVWVLTGVAIRVAEGMGMRLDGALLGLSPFETEIRRRIWWQLRMHDFRAAELCGQPKFRDFKLDETTPKRPANVNDSELYPTMLQAAVESTRPTEMIWCVFRTELASFAATQIARMQKLGKTGFTSEEYAAMDDLKIKDVFIDELEDVIETKYLRFCDPSQPLQLLTLVVGRSAMNLIRFMAHHPRRWATLERVPESEQQLVWDICIQLMEKYGMMQSSPQLRRFAWNVPYFLSWPAIIHVLDTLKAEPLHRDAEKAWQLIDNMYEAYSEMLLNLKKPIFAAVGGLCLKAFGAREVSLAKQKRSLSNPPGYITKLREQREAAKARRRSVIARSKGQETFHVDNGKTLVTTNTDTAWSETNPSSVAETLLEAPRQQQQYLQAANLVQGSTSNRSADDAFWLSGALADGFSSDGAADMMNLDTDAILAQDCWLDTHNGEAMDWAQWDAWLGNLDPVRPNINAGT